MTRIDTPISGARGHFRDEGVAPCGDHGCGVAMHEWLGRDMNIPEHLVTAPADDDLYNVGIDVTQEEGH